MFVFAELESSSEDFWRWLEVDRVSLLAIVIVGWHSFPILFLWAQIEIVRARVSLVVRVYGCPWQPIIELKPLMASAFRLDRIWSCKFDSLLLVFNYHLLYVLALLSRNWLLEKRWFLCDDILLLLFKYFLIHLLVAHELLRSALIHLLRVFQVSLYSFAPIDDTRTTEVIDFD